MIREALKKIKSLTSKTKSQKQSLAQCLKGNNVLCPCCEGEFVTFLPFGLIKRANALCPLCNSLERHRLMWLYLKVHSSFFKQNIRLLHVAPEALFFNKFSKDAKIEYYPGDLFTEGNKYPEGTFNLDITNIQFEDGYFDVIICSHVLEHVPDDLLAMKELKRVMKPKGWAVLQVPLDKTRNETYEDFSITAPADREKAFGQFDHVRVYGIDYKNRLEEAGFIVEKFSFKDIYSPNEIFRYGLLDEDVYICYK